jgi:GntR family transcriptional regulator/MocR family aminotransferase
MVQSLGIHLDPRSREPMYQQLFDQLVERIRSGAFPSGFRLPPTRSLAGSLQTNRNTVVRAYEDLLAAGFVESTVGRGTFVAAAQPPVTQPPPGPRPSADERSGGSLPWTTLLARAAWAEPLSRMEWLQRSVAPMSTDVINLARLEPAPDLIPDELIRRCSEQVLRTLGGRALRYSAREGLLRLRGLVAEDLGRQGVPASAEDVIVTSGSQQAIDLLARALLDPGEAVLVDEATYAGALGIFSARGARLLPIPSDDEGPSLAALERAGQTRPKCLYLMPNCHNPTGATISQRRREALVAWSRRAGVPLIEDDYVAQLNLDGASPPAMRVLDADVVYVGSFSKCLAPAIRVGFLVVPPVLRPKIVSLKYAMDTGSSELLQHVLAEFLERGYLRAHLQRALPAYRRRRDVLESALTRHLPRSLSCRRPEQGLFLWLPLPEPMSPQAVFEQAQRKGVLVHPSTLNAVDGRGGGGIRLTFCGEGEPRLAEGARRLGRALATLAGGERQGEPVTSMGGI